MTAAIMDSVSYRGQCYVIAGIHGEGLFSPYDHGIAPGSVRSTADHRGFDCNYEVRDGFLWLERLNMANPSGPVLPLPLRVPFTGSLLLATEMVRALYVHMGFQPAHRFQVVHEATFNSGRLTKETCRSAEMALFREELANRRLTAPRADQESALRSWLRDCFRVLGSMPEVCPPWLHYPAPLPDPLSVSVLTAALGSGEPWEKCAAADLLQQIGPAAQDAVPALRAALHDPSWDACQCLGDGRQAEQRLRYVRERAVRALAVVAPGSTANAAIPVMAELIRQRASPLLEGERACYVRFSVEEVRRFGPAAPLAMLDAYASHPDHWAFARDAQALLTVDRTTAVSFFSKRLFQGDVAAKCDAADQLAALGPAAEAATPALLHALADLGFTTEQTEAGDFTMTTHRYVRDRAVRALARINPTAAGSAAGPVIRELQQSPDLITFDGDGNCLQTHHVSFTPQELAVFGLR